MRKENPVLIYGDLKFTIADDQKMVLGYTRTSDDDEIVIIFNRSGQVQTVVVPVNRWRCFHRHIIRRRGIIYDNQIPNSI